jgi:acylglycerol lipase
MTEATFSLDELRLAAKVNIPDTNSITTSDGIPLAYRKYVPVSPRSAVLFYHGGGAHSGAGYQFLGNGLQTNFNIAVYMPDIRGHGASGGRRGDAPNPKQVWDDITTFVKFVRTQHPHLPLFIGGHSSGAGLILNYIGQPNHESAEGYMFLSPQLGRQALIDRPEITTPFAVVDASAFTAYAMSGGTAHGNEYAVKFNYPAEVLEADRGLVAAITVNMSVALIPSSPQQQFASLDRPFGLWIGAEDELFVPERVLAFADRSALPVRAGSGAMSIPGARHLSVLVDAHKTIGPWLTKKTADKAIKD